MMYDLCIVGGGPAGVAAGVYAARKRLKTVFIAGAIGGQSTDSIEIQNWIGTEKISGEELGHSLERHLRAYAEDIVEIHEGEFARSVERAQGGFSVMTDKGTYEARAVLVATGGMRRKLDVPGAAEFEHKGLTYCASCDGPLFAGQDVVVVGGGNAGFESASQLLAYCKTVTLVHRGESFSKADESTVRVVTAHPNMKALPNTEPVRVVGKQFVEGIVVKNRKTGDETTLPAAGIFVEIGMMPSTDYLKDVVERDEAGRIVIDPKNQRTSTEGIWAAGDATNGLYHQNNIDAGDAVKALEDIYYWLKTK